jgi:hypothetical protein
MRVCLTKFTDEVADFLTNETLKAIDYGILDLHHIKNRELRNVFYFLEELLTVELELNYLENETGIFRVCRRGNFWYYKQGKHIIKAICLDELKKLIKQKSLGISTEDIEFVTNKRQQTCLLRCKESLERALDGVKMHELQDMIYIDVKSALLSLDEITGEVINDEILNNIFDHFCIGK